MKFGAYLLPEKLDEFVSSARAAEVSGYDRAWVVDGQMLYRDVFIYMALALAETERLVFGTGVTNPITRHRSVVANVFSTLDELYPGRVILGLSRGDNAVRTLGMKPLPTAELERCVADLKALARGEEVDFGGFSAKIRWTHKEVPLMVAASGPRNLRIAGAVADLVQLQVGVSSEALKWAIDLVREGAEAAGRDPAEVEISIICGMWVDDDPDRALAMGRWAVPSASLHFETVVKGAKGAGVPAPLREVVEARHSAGVDFDYGKDHGNTSMGDRTAWITPGLIRNFSIVGDAEYCRAEIRRLAELGVQEIAGAFLNGEDEQIRRVGTEIIAPYRDSAATDSGH